KRTTWTGRKISRKTKSPAAKITYTQAGISCFVGQESAKFEVQFFVGSLVVKSPKELQAAFRASLGFIFRLMWSETSRYPSLPSISNRSNTLLEFCAFLPGRHPMSTKHSIGWEL